MEQEQQEYAPQYSLQERIRRAIVGAGENVAAGSFNDLAYAILN